MTVTTQREIRSEINGVVPTLDSPAAPARARASIGSTQRNVKPAAGKTPSKRPSLRNWWVWTSTPASFAATWSASKVDRSRIPGGSQVLFVLWQVSNWTDRLVTFALILALPTGATGALRWIAPRPTRRYGLYLTIAAFLAAYLIGVN